MIVEVLTYTHDSPESVQRFVLMALVDLRQKGLTGPIKDVAHLVRKFDVSPKHMREVEKTLKRKKIPYRKIA